MHNSPSIELRERLLEITKTAPVEDHALLIEGIRSQFGHTIYPVPPGDPRAPAQQEYTCFGYAFGLADSPEYTRLASRPLAPFANSRFVSFHLWSGRLREVDLDDAHSSDVLVYYRTSEPSHAGVLLPKPRITSKWGIGLLYEHGLFEVPSIYGNKVRAFTGNSTQAALQSFCEFTEAEGFDLQ